MKHGAGKPGGLVFLHHSRCKPAETWRNALQVPPSTVITFRVYTQNANAVCGAKLFYTQDGIGSLAIKLGAWHFTENWLCAAGLHFFCHRFEQGKAGG